MQTYGKRQSPRSIAARREAERDSVGYHPSEIDTRYVGSGMIQPGAHPERGEVVPFGNPFRQIGGLLKRLGGRRKK